jgi:hypothetical protein
MRLFAPPPPPAPFPDCAMTPSSSSSTSVVQSSGAMGDAVAAPFYATVNVKQHVPIVPNLERPNYSKWKAFFTPSVPSMAC